jgi:hypothetical protein
MTIDGVTESALVDGGVNSPAGESVEGKPYYNTPGDLRDRLYANATWQSNAATGAITNFDVPGLAKSIPSLNFETYFVLTNYAGSGQDRVVGRIDWGYTSDGKGNAQPIGTPHLVLTDSFSHTASIIILHDYPKYQIIR